MANIERMTIAVPEPMAAKIRAAVDRGEYASASEVMRDAVRLWDERRELRGEQIEALRQAWDSGRTSGIAGPLDMAAILRDARNEKDGTPPR